MKNLKKILPKLIFFIVISAVVLIVLFSLHDMQEIGAVIQKASWRWLLFCFLFLLIYILLNPIPIVLLGHSKTHESISTIDSYMIGTMEYFFNGLTPFSSGGQPFQIYSYSKIGVSLSRGSGLILMNFVINQIAIVILCVSSLFFFQTLTQGVPHLIIMIVIGLVINIFILTIFCSVGLSKTIRNLLNRLVRFILTRKIFKNKLEKYIAVFEQYCAGAQSTFKSLLGMKFKFFISILAKLTGLICYYMIPYFILLSLGIEVQPKDIALIVSMTTFAIAMTCYIPTPGASGGIEFAFQSLFVTVIPAMTSSVAASGMLLWRMITYYFLMLISLICYIVFEQVIARRHKKMHHEQENLFR
ncbi:MAG: flippase-like domain-containing protein [Anaeroplasmataceae bacterium]|nr:flippase-like domain-containing protein [Anaeroplasmataceae bacterium]